MNIQATNIFISFQFYFILYLYFYALNLKKVNGH